MTLTELLERPETRDAIADAIAKSSLGFSMNLIRLVDDIRTYSLKYSDGVYLEFCDDETDECDAQDRLYAHVAARKRLVQADAVIAALSPIGGEAEPVAVPDGWALVPKEPTPEMCMAIAAADWQGSSDLNWDDGYRIMVAAAPQGGVK